MGAAPRKRVETGSNSKLSDQISIQPSITQMQARMDQFARDVILNFASTTPDPYMYPYSHSLSIATPMLRMNGTLSLVN